jgi:DNA-directed RNA polymerase beta' subunit
MVLHSVKDEIQGNKMKIPEVWAQELSFYFKNKEINIDRIHSNGAGLSGPVFESFETVNTAIDGVIDLIFMTN